MSVKLKRLKWAYLKGDQIEEAQKVFLEVLGRKNPDLEDWRDFVDEGEVEEIQIHIDSYGEVVIDLLQRLKEKGLLLRLERGGLIFESFHPEVEEKVERWARENGLMVIP